MICKNCRKRPVQEEAAAEKLGWCSKCLALYLLENHLRKHPNYKKMHLTALKEMQDEK